MEHESEEQKERAVGAEGAEGARAGIARSQHALYVLPNDAGAVGSFLAPALERALAARGEEEGGEAAAPRLLVVAPDADSTVAITAWVAQHAAAAEPSMARHVLPVTSARRAARLLAGECPPVVAGPPAPLLELVRGSALKLGGVRGVVIAWADAILDAGDMDALERVLAEVPKEAARTIVASRLTPEIEALVERYARRPRRVGAAEAGASPGDAVEVRYVETAPRARPESLRRLLDELDPPRASVFARSDAAAREVADTLHALGYPDAVGGVTCTRGERMDGVALTVLWELPASREALRALATPGASVVALVTPRQLPALRALAGDGHVAPVTLPDAVVAARSKEDRMRDELRGVLEDAFPARELLAVEPLLAEYDGATIAAAALRLLDRERERPRARETAAPARPAAVARVFINAGTRDGVAARDLVGAIANETGIAGDRIGRVELRENHAVVEVPAADAEQVCARLTGVLLRGRRLLARIDREQRERPPRTGEPRAPRTGRPPRPPRSPRPSAE